MRKQTSSGGAAGMRSDQVSYAFVSLLIAACGASAPLNHDSNAGHDSAVAIANDLLTGESGDPIPDSLPVLFALNTLISQHGNRQTLHLARGAVSGSARFLLA